MIILKSIPRRRRRSRQYIVIIHTLLFRHIFAQLAEIPGYSQYSPSPDIGSDVFVAEIPVFCDCFEGAVLFVIIYAS